MHLGYLKKILFFISVGQNKYDEYKVKITDIRILC